MKLIIADIIQSRTAAYQDEGQHVYTLLEESMRVPQSFTLSFQGLETCSTRFLNASIGRLYRAFPFDDINSKMTITDISDDDKVLPEMIRRAIDKALNPVIYSQLREQTLANA